MFDLGFREAQDGIATCVQILVLVVILAYYIRQAMPIVAIGFYDQHRVWKPEIADKNRAVVVTDRKLFNVFDTRSIKRRAQCTLNACAGLSDRCDGFSPASSHQLLILRYGVPRDQTGAVTCARTIDVAVADLARRQWCIAREAGCSIFALMFTNTKARTGDRTVYRALPIPTLKRRATCRTYLHWAVDALRSPSCIVVTGARTVVRIVVAGYERCTTVGTHIARRRSAHGGILSTKDVRQWWGVGVDAYVSAGNYSALALPHYTPQGAGCGA